jgi:hypothetical protein
MEAEEEERHKGSLTKKRMENFSEMQNVCIQFPWVNVMVIEKL